MSQNWIVEFYQDSRGHVPIREFLTALQLEDRARVLRSITLLESYGPALKMPHVRHLRGKLWELRIDGRPNSYRILYAAMPGQKFILLHSFAKKTGKTPNREVKTALNRLADFSARLSR